MKDQSVTQKPWLMPNGEMKRDERIQAAGQNWNQETWDAYLDATVDTPQQAALIKTRKYDAVCEDETESIFEQWVGSGFAPSEVKVLIKKFKGSLSGDDQKLLRLRFWHQKNTAEIARALCIRHQTCTARETKILSRFKDLVQKHRQHFLVVRGPIDFEISQTK